MVSVIDFTFLLDGSVSSRKVRKAQIRYIVKLKAENIKELEMLMTLVLNMSECVRVRGGERWRQSPVTPSALDTVSLRGKSLV